jgi:hypothetical protein
MSGIRVRKERGFEVRSLVYVSNIRLVDVSYSLDFFVRSGF